MGTHYPPPPLSLPPPPLPLPRTTYYVYFVIRVRAGQTRAGCGAGSRARRRLLRLVVSFPVPTDHPRPFASPRHPLKEKAPGQADTREGVRVYRDRAGSSTPSASLRAYTRGKGASTRPRACNSQCYATSRGMPVAAGAIAV